MLSFGRTIAILVQGVAAIKMIQVIIYRWWLYTLYRWNINALLKMFIHIFSFLIQKWFKWIHIECLCSLTKFQKFDETARVTDENISMKQIDILPRSRIVDRFEYKMYPKKHNWMDYKLFKHISLNMKRRQSTIRSVRNTVSCMCYQLYFRANSAKRYN